MNNQRAERLINRTIELLNANQPLLDITFPENEVVVASQIKIGLLGTQLWVPPTLCAVLRLKDGGQQELYPGKYILHYFPGIYPLHFVDLRRHSTQLPTIQAFTDGWEVKLTLKIIWGIAGPAHLVGSPSPEKSFLLACEGLLRNYIQSLPHDQLVGAPGTTPVTDTDIAKYLREQTLKSPACKGFVLLEVIVLDRQGDRQRIAEQQRSNVARVRIEQSLGLLDKEAALSIRKVDQDAAIQKAKLLQDKEILDQQFPIKDATLQQEVDLLGKKGTVAVGETYIARAQEEEKERVRLRKAEIDAEVAAKLLPSQEQALLLQLLRDVPHWEQDYRQEYLDAQKMMLGQLASVLLQALTQPGVQRGVDGESLKALTGLLQNLVQNQPAPPPAPAREFTATSLQSTSPTLQERLAALSASSTTRPNGHGSKLPDSIAG